MTDDLALVVVPYERFLERRERRRRVADELGRREERRSFDGGAPAVAVMIPIEAGSTTDTHHDGPVLPRGLGQRQI